MDPPRLPVLQEIERLAGIKSGGSCDSSRKKGRSGKMKAAANTAKKKKARKKTRSCRRKHAQKKTFKKTRTKTCKKNRTRNLNFMERNITSNAEC